MVKVNVENVLSDQVIFRRQVWEVAVELVEPLIEKHDVKTYSLGQLFVNTTTVTALDQHVNTIIQVAEWLLES